MRSDRLRLTDILDALDVVARYLPADRAVFDRDPLLQSHIFRHLMIVGEASYMLSKGLKARYPQIPWKKIEGMRHILVHDYFKVDWNIIFVTAQVHMPLFKPQVQAMLAELAPEDAAQ